MSHSTTDSLTQVAALSTTKLHLVAPDTVYPALHDGWHVKPDASLDVQSPTTPFVRAADALHCVGEHDAALSTPSLQLVAPDIVHHASQVGWDVEPDGRLARHESDRP